VNENNYVGQEEEITNLLESVPGGVFKYEAKPHGQFSFVSTQLLRVLGYTEQEFRDKFHNCFDEMIYEEDREKTLASIDAQIKKSEFDTCEYRIQAKDGSLMWFSDVGHIVSDKNGKKWFYVVVVNIDAERELQRTKQLEIDNFNKSMQDILKSNPDSLCTFYLNLTQNICSVGFGRSSYISETLSSPTADGLLLNILSIIENPEQKKLISSAFNRDAILAGFQKGKTNFYVDYQRKNEIGSYSWVRTYCNLFKNPTSNDIEGIIYSLDIERDKNWQAIIDELVSDDYDFLSLLNLDNNTISEYSNKGKSFFFSEKLANMDYTKAFTEALSNLIRKDKLEEAIEAHSIASIKKHLAKEPVYRPTFPTKFGGEEEWRISYLSGSKRKVLIARKDVTKLRRKERKYIEELQAAKNAAEVADRMKMDFLSRMSHDIRTPLNGIIGMSYLAQEQNNPPETMKYLKNIDISSQFLLGLINEILDMSKLNNGKMVLHMEPYTRDEFQAYINAVVQPLCAERNQKFTFNLKAPTDYCAMLDKLCMNRIIFNLLSNAVKYTPEGGKIGCTIQANVLPDKRKIAVHVEVTDNGVGISDEFQKVMFDPFTQENRNDNSHRRGTGLGLAITKKMVEALNGTIKVRSKLGVGSAFIIDLMNECVTAPTSVQQAAAQVVLHPKPGDYSTLKGKHVLICEDHPLNQEIAKTLLEKRGMIVTIADEGRTGVNTFAKSSLNYFSCVLMDIRMPVMNGYEATQAIRSLNRPDAKKIPIIAMTADAFSEDIKKCMSAGMNDHIAKPINPLAMFNTIAKNLV
jgi:PAS domain S-box-containing protein